ncbi:YqkE family protein [Neobacillus sp. PS3-40]|uniref:YqkE family protein n=1 Tax=Neobacillus sp. PS3-40 TaxID=3070679 RepID=UPI0027DF2A06|nr:YqkE family protein [Neobacillus sp. PS3-40]WML45194.1 YqkE family protein [Neobacillus sp. PS3-40]
MKKQPKPKAKKDDAVVTLGDMINQDLFKQLKEKQHELKATEVKKKEEEEQRKREERRLKEKNKSFEELLNESGMNWKEFK